MNPKTILLLLTTITLSTAIPFSQQQTPASTPTKQSAHPALSSIAASASVSPKANNVSSRLIVKRWPIQIQTKIVQRMSCVVMDNRGTKEPTYSRNVSPTIKQ
ncbi:hypothetical protein AFCA_007834 [Aspergillus flavus]|nr:hypothetical protein AFCA_007834 [Aspergillus flavus]